MRKYSLPVAVKPVEPVAKETDLAPVIEAIIDSARANVYAGQRLEHLSAAMEAQAVKSVSVKIIRDAKGDMKELLITRSPQHT